MSAIDKPTASWTEQDLESLCAHQLREGPRLEFKSELSLDTQGEKNEAERDAIGMANSGGGHIIYGIAELTLPDGSTAADSLASLADGGIGERLNNVLDSRCNPRLAFDIYTITSDHVGVYVVVEIFGHRRPHMGNDGRYHLRRNLLVRQMTEAEVFEAYSDRVRRDAAANGYVHATGSGADDPFSGESISRVHRGLRPSELAMYVAEGGDLSGPGWMSVVVGPSPLQEDILDPVDIRVDDIQRLTIDSPWYGEQPLTHYRLRPTLESFRAQLPPRDDVAPAYLLDLSSDGLMEFGTTLEPALRFEDEARNRTIASRSVAEYAHDYSLLFIEVLNHLGYDGRVKAKITFDNIRGHVLGIERGRYFGAVHPIGDDSVESRVLDTSVGEFQDALGAWLKHTMDRLFLAGGIDSGAYFLDEYGEMLES